MASAHANSSPTEFSKLWNNREGCKEYQNLAIERNFKREGDTEFTTQTVNIAADKILSVARPRGGP